MGPHESREAANCEFSTYGAGRTLCGQCCGVSDTRGTDEVQIVEELEYRFGDKMDDILSAVKSSLSETHPTVNGTSEGGNADQTLKAESTVYTEYEDEFTQDAEQWDYDANEVVFDDTGEGAGVEGELDMEDV